VYFDVKRVAVVPPHKSLLASLQSHGLAFKHTQQLSNKGNITISNDSPSWIMSVCNPISARGRLDLISITTYSLSLRHRLRVPGFLHLRRAKRIPVPRLRLTCVVQVRRTSIRTVAVAVVLRQAYIGDYESPHRRVGVRTSKHQAHDLHRCSAGGNAFLYSRLCVHELATIKA
jgi:hypothetical protein